MLTRLFFVNGQRSTVNGHDQPLRRINVCLIFIGIIDTSLLGLLMAHSPLLIALKKTLAIRH